VKNPELAALRSKLESIDAEIAALLSRRLDLCRDVAKIKKKSGLGVEDPHWEKEIFNRIAQWENQYSLKDQELTKTFKVILELSRNTQRRLIETNQV
jgi:chorismate mutase